MALKSFAKASGRLAVAALLVVSLSGNKGCDPKTGVTVKYVREQIPDKYEQCFEKIVRIEDYETNGVVLWKDFQRYAADLQARNNELRKCGKGAVAWVKARDNVLNRYLGQ